MTQSIQERVKNANAAYSAGVPYLTDIEYDLLWQELHALDPYNKHLYHTARNPNLGQDIHPHLYKIKGTNKAFKQDDLKPFLQRFGNQPLILEPKYDGCAGVLYRQSGEKFKLLLEGNGLAGRDISHHLNRIKFTWYPDAVESVELIIPWSRWEDSYGANPRNVVAGWLARTELPHNIEMVGHNESPLLEEYNYDGNLDLLSEKLLELHTIWKAIYPIDGIMIKVKDHKLRLTSDTHDEVYAWSIAWKPPIQTADTSVTNIEWNVSRTGRVIPTVVYKEIELCGTKNTRATGNNAQWIKDKNIKQKDIITIGKAGEIIPKIICIKEKIDQNNTWSILPVYCPMCKERLKFKGVHLICDNDKCIASLIKSISYFYSDKGMDLKSIGENMIADLLDNPDIYNVLIDNPWALLSPKEYNIYDQIISIWGQAKTKIYIYNLNKINKTKNACHFIAALGKKGCAYKTALKCYHSMKGYEIKSHIQKDASINFAFSMIEYYKANKFMLSFNFIPIPEPPKILYCITGALSSSRNDMIAYLESQQWRFSNQVSKFVSILIVGDKPGKTKITKAKEHNILMIKEIDLPNYIKKGD